MGFLDKVKTQADALAQKAQQGLAQGQAKVDEVQAKRAADALLRDLGTAYYAEQRSGGGGDAVAAALEALDRHVAEHGPIGSARSAPERPEPPTPPPAYGGSIPPPAVPPLGSPESAAGPPVAPPPSPTSEP